MRKSRVRCTPIGVFSLFFLFVLTACHRDRVIRFEGEAQGTTYHITVVACVKPDSQDRLQQLITARLDEIDKSLSNYRDDSELSAFNRAPVNTWIDLGRDMYAVLKISDQISRESAGAFDITVAPLVALWGFGPTHHAEYIPDDSSVAAARANVGYQMLEIDPVLPRARKHAELAIDVNGIAQGFSVDQLADVLTAEECTDFLVEVGGELRLAGYNAEGKPWRIGIEKPVDGFSATQQALIGTGIGVTTAGDYRDYYEKEGVRYSHTIDPRSGRPIAHKLASVTVVADNATLADGYDTVLEVLGPEAGAKFAQDHRLAAYFVVRDGTEFTTRYTSDFLRYLK